MLTDIMGNLEIADGEGCLCADISFGFNGVGCTQIDFGEFSVPGIQNIRVQGNPGFMGTQIKCGGTQ